MTEASWERHSDDSREQCNGHVGGVLEKHPRDGRDGHVHCVTCRRLVRWRRGMLASPWAMCERCRRVIEVAAGDV